MLSLAPPIDSRQLTNSCRQCKELDFHAMFIYHLGPFQCNFTLFSVDYYTTLFGYFQLCGIMAGPIVGCIFDRALLKCCNSSDESEAALLDSPVRTHVVRMKESVLPFALTNGMCLVLSVLSLLKWKPGLVSINVTQPLILIEVLYFSRLKADIHPKFQRRVPIY